jgi:hypothetical protein
MFEIVMIHLNRADNNYNKILKFDLNSSIFEDSDKVDTIDAFIFRFTKLQDYLGDKFFKELLNALGEFKKNMPFIEILDRLEKLDIIKSSDKWLEYRQLRNSLTHEYPDEYEYFIENIKLSLLSFNEMKIDIENIKRFITLKKLI